MSTITCTDARQTAADLLAVAARHPAADIGTRLACLAAEAALETPGRPTAKPAKSNPDELITAALRALGKLPLDAFADSRVIAAARHARRALRGAQ